jgi:CRP/FNR family transcriptional regulator
VFTRPNFERALGDFAKLERQLLRRTLGSLDESRRWMLRLGRRSAEARVAGFLLDVSRRMAPEGFGPEALPRRRFDLPLTRGEIGDVLGLTIETVSRQFTRLAREGLISLEGRRGVVLLDVAALRDVSGEA